jgi:hypothetical protein
MANKPSIYFCLTGYLEEGEKYNQNLHNYGETPEERGSAYYDSAYLLMKTNQYLAHLEQDINDTNKPSIYFCLTGCLEEGEKYNQNLHNYGETPEERGSAYYDSAYLLMKTNQYLAHLEQDINDTNKNITQKASLSSLNSKEF